MVVQPAPFGGQPAGPRDELYPMVVQLAPFGGQPAGPRDELVAGAGGVVLWWWWWWRGGGGGRGYGEGGGVVARGKQSKVSKASGASKAHQLLCVHRSR